MATRRPDFAIGNLALSGSHTLTSTVIHSASHWKYAADGLDFLSPAFAEDRLRGNDWCIERDPIPNDTTTRGRVRLTWCDASGYVSNVALRPEIEQGVWRFETYLST